MQTLATYLVKQLSAWSVRHVYGVVGDTFLPLMDALDRQTDLRFIPVRHEAAAGFMASAEAKLTGRLAVCVATSGPGIANLMNGLGDAAADRVPILALTGQVERRKLGTESKQYIDQQSLVRPLAGYTALLADPAGAGQLLPAAMRAALGKGQVAHLSIPKDLFTLECPAHLTPPEPFLGAPAAADPAVIASAARMMAGARRPLILAGHGSRPATADLIRLAERWGAGIILTMPAKGVVPASHPLVLGGLGAAGSDASHAALERADLLLALGSNWWPEKYVPRTLPVIKVDSHPDRIGGKMSVQFGVPGEIRAVLPGLIAGLPEHTRAEWMAELDRLRRDWLAKVDREAAPAGPPLPPQHIMRALEQALPPDAIISLDTGDHSVWWGRIFGGERHEVLLSGNWRSLGFGVPAALAAKLCRPDRTVVALVGDGALQSLLGELVTAASLGLPVLIIVVNNGTMAIEQNRMKAQGLSTLGSTPGNPDFTALARACGLEARRAERPGELAEMIREGLSRRTPFLIEAMASAPAAPTAWKEKPAPEQEAREPVGAVGSSAVR